MLAIAVLTWCYPKLEHTLKSYEEHGLLAYADERIMFIQEMDEKSEALAKKYGFKVCGATENIGIGQAYQLMAQFAKSEYIIFLQDDFVLLRNPVKHLEDAMALGVDCVKLRDRKNPGEPLWTAQFKDGLVPETHLLDIIHWDEPPFEQRNGFYIAPSRHANYTDNPCLYKREWWLKEIGSRFGNLYCRMHEHATQEWWKNQSFTVAQGEGLFTHQDFGRKWLKHGHTKGKTIPAPALDGDYIPNEELPLLACLVRDEDRPLLQFCLDSLHRNNNEIPWIQVVSDSKEWLPYYHALKDYEKAFINKWLIGGYGGFAKKFALTLAVNSQQDVVMFDADILFHGNFTDYLKTIDRACIYSTEDVWHSYDLGMALALDHKMYTQKAFNCGMSYYPKGRIRQHLTQEVYERMTPFVEGEPSYFVEQTLLGYVCYKDGARYWPREVVGVDGTPVVRHYAGKKGLFWEDCKSCRGME